MIIDTSALIALFNQRDPRHPEANQTLSQSTEGLVVSPYVIAEVDYLVSRRLGIDAELTVLRELAGGAWDLAQLDTDDVAQVVEVVERYRDQDVGITDASLVVLAARHRTRTVATFDRRHFEVLRPIQGGRFRIVPR